MIDYGLTFTKRGRKPYLTITDKEVCHVFSVGFKTLIVNNFVNNFFSKMQIKIILGILFRAN